jgi:2-keto-3-deoxy-L-rhamnonate aldolase RhmA
MTRHVAADVVNVADVLDVVRVADVSGVDDLRDIADIGGVDHIGDIGGVHDIGSDLRDIDDSPGCPASRPAAECDRATATVLETGTGNVTPLGR